MFLQVVSRPMPLLCRRACSMTAPSVTWMVGRTLQRSCAICWSQLGQLRSRQHA